MHREQQASIIPFLGYSSMVIPQGYPVTLMTGGDFWVVNAGTSAVAFGAGPGVQKAFASVLNGAVSFGAPGTIGGTPALATSAVLTTSGFTVTGSISGNVLTVSGNTSGGVYPGATVSAPGAGVVTQVLTGNPTSTVATFLLSQGSQSVTSTVITGLYDVLVVPGYSGTTTNTVAVGDALFVGTTNVGAVGYSITASTFIVSFGPTVAATSFSAASAIETKWYAQSSGLPGELVKITDHPPT